MKSRSYILIISSVLFCVVLLSLPIRTFALPDSGEKYYDKGRWYGRELCLNANCSSTTDDGKGDSTVVISAGAFNEVSTGYEKVRIWSRLGTIYNIYPQKTFDVWTNQAQVDFLADDANRMGALTHAGTFPQHKPTTEQDFNSVLYTIMNYILPGSDVGGGLLDILKAATGDENVSGTAVSNIDVNGKRIDFYTPSNLDLPMSVPYSTAERDMGPASGATAKFTYNMQSGVTNYQVKVAGRVQYAVGYIYPNVGYVVNTYWSSRPYIVHTVKTS